MQYTIIYILMLNIQFKIAGDKSFSRSFMILFSSLFHVVPVASILRIARKIPSCFGWKNFGPVGNISVWLEKFRFGWKNSKLFRLEKFRLEKFQAVSVGKIFDKFM